MYLTQYRIYSNNCSFSTTSFQDALLWVSRGHVVEVWIWDESIQEYRMAEFLNECSSTT